MDLTWELVERSQGVYDFAPWDALVNALEERELSALLILDYFNPIYCETPMCGSHTGPTTPEQRQAFAEFAAAAAARFGDRDVMLEVWNEPNHSGFWGPQPDPVAYARLAAEALGAIRAANDAVPVAVGATAGIDVWFLDDALAAGGLESADLVSVHPYREPGPETIREDLALAAEIIADRTGRDDIPLISGEWGYTSTQWGGLTDAALHRQGVFAARELLSVLANGLPLAIWYDLSNDCGDPEEWECNFGLLREDGATPKPAWLAVKALTDTVPDEPVEARLCGRPPAVYCLSFSGSTRAVAALWTGQEGADVLVHLPEDLEVEVSDLYGDAVALPAQGPPRFTLRERDGPVYVSTPLRHRRPDPWRLSP